MVVGQQQVTPGLTTDEQGADKGQPFQPASAADQPNTIPVTPVVDAPKVPVSESEQVKQVAERSAELGPDREVREFTAKLCKEPGKGIGLDISAHDGVTLLIGKIKEGPVNTWNNSPGIDPFEKVRRGDRIVSVNSVSGNSDLILETLKQGTSDFTAVIRRVTQFRVVCPRKDALGLEHDASNFSDLIIRAVTEGTFRDANKKNKADMEMRATDQIIQVNGQTGNTEMLVGLIQSGPPELDMLIRRPSY